MAVVLSSGTRLWLADELPATDNAAGYNPLDWVLVGEVTDLGEVGSTVSMVEHIPLQTGVVRKLPGSINNNTLSVTVAFDPNDDGQDLARDAMYARREISVKIQMPDEGYTRFFSTGFVSGFPVSIGSADAILGGTITIELNRTPFERTTATP